ncbi:MAG: hypothetical protein WCH98_08270 [Verrucomicrobiota bacterium]
MNKPTPLRIIWTLCAAGGKGPDEHAYILRAMERAAAEGVSGIELCYRSVDRLVAYRAFPRLAAAVDRAELERNQAAMREISEKAHALGLRFGLWHHEVHGPEDLLELMPELRAEDGLINLEAPLLYEFIREKCAEFLDLFPAVDELVLTLTETKFVVAHRPFSPVPPAERIRRVIQAVADATEPREKTLVIRPFSAVRADELYVREAVGQLRASRVAMMYKTEPFDWNPFLPDEDLIGSIPDREVRAETDAGAEYYGQADFPCCYARFLDRRLAAARSRGATVAAIRVDRGWDYQGLWHPLNEANIIAPTRLLQGRAPTMDAAWLSWLKERHGGGSAELVDLFEETFDVIRHSLYLDGQSLSHRAFPTMDIAKTILTFALFEQDIPLDHLPEHWSMLTDRRTPTHAEILNEKEKSLALAHSIRERFDSLGKQLSESSRVEIARSLDRLPLLAEACLRFCRVVIAHVEEMHTGKTQLTDSFDQESEQFANLADHIEAEFGPVFFRKMAPAMRSVLEGLKAERLIERPLREALQARTDVVDFVLCGFATEMHRVAKRVHTGKTGYFSDRMFRASGLGVDEYFGYLLKARPGAAHRLVLQVAGPSGEGFLEVNGARFPLAGAADEALSVQEFALPASDAVPLPLRVWSTSAQRVRLAGIELCSAHG